MIEDETIDVSINLGKKVSCHLQDGLNTLCPFCDTETKICISKLHSGFCKFHKVVGNDKKLD